MWSSEACIFTSTMLSTATLSHSMIRAEVWHTPKHQSTRSIFQREACQNQEHVTIESMDDFGIDEGCLNEKCLAVRPQGITTSLTCSHGTDRSINQAEAEAWSMKSEQLVNRSETGVYLYKSCCLLYLSFES